MDASQSSAYVATTSRAAILFAHVIEHTAECNGQYCPATFAAIDRLAHVAGCRGKTNLMLNRFRGQPTPFTVAQFRSFMRMCSSRGQNQENTSSHRDGTDAFVAECGRQQWRLARMTEVDPRRSPKTFRVLSRCSDEQLKELMHVWGTVDRWPLVKKLYPEMPA